MKTGNGTHPLLYRTDWVSLVEKYRETDPAEFVLRFGRKKEAYKEYSDEMTGMPVREIAEQIHCYPRAETKLGPIHCAGMVYRREALEQASGYATSVFRARQWVNRLSVHSRGTGNDRSASVETGISADAIAETGVPVDHEKPLVADLNGGLGVDAAAWVMAGARVVYGERDNELLAIARHNHKQRNCDRHITYYSGDAVQWLQRCASGEYPAPDLLYLDPSRRSKTGRVITLEGSEPAVLEILPLIRQVTDRYLLKLSPMLDLSRVQDQLPDCREITVLSVTGEVKELLADCHTGVTPDYLKASNPLHRAVLLNKSGEVVFEVTSSGVADTGNLLPDSNDRSPSTFHTGTDDYLYEPDPAIFKAGLIDVTASYFGLVRMHPGVGYLAGNRHVSGFPGRCYRIRETLAYKPKTLRSYLKRNNLRNVHIHQRNFPVTVDQLYRKLGCSMGDDAHLIATKGSGGNFVIVIADMKSHQVL